jgi:hypothetical protein
LSPKWLLYHVVFTVHKGEGEQLKGHGAESPKSKMCLKSPTKIFLL